VAALIRFASHTPGLSHPCRSLFQNHDCSVFIRSPRLWQSRIVSPARPAGIINTDPLFDEVFRCSKSCGKTICLPSMGGILEHFHGKG
jgi:hypothetical protein